MQLSPRFGRLFWKLFAAVWLAMNVAFVGALVYVNAIGFKPSSPMGDNYVPLAPFVSGAIVSLAVSGLIAWYISRPLRHLR